MTYQQILKQIASEQNLPEEVVDKVYKTFWQFIREHITSLPLKEDLSKEDFEDLYTNFNIPSLGKLSCSYDRMINVKKRFKYIKDIKNGSADKDNS